MKPTLRQLQYLVAIADTQSFSKAAQICAVSQPSLSQQVKDMEYHIGATLIERRRNGAALTPIGQEIIIRARAILRDVEDMKALARDAGDDLTGTVRIGTLPSIGPYLLPLATRQLHAAYPQLRLQIYEERGTDLHAGLVDGTRDVILAMPENHPAMASLNLFHEYIYVCVAPDDALAASDKDIELTELAGRTLLSLGSNHSFGRIVHDLAQVAGAEISKSYVGTSLDAIRQMSAMGDVVAILPSLYCLSEAASDPGLHVRKLNHKMAERDIGLIWRPSSPLARKFEKMGETFADAAQTLLGQAT